MAYLIGTKVVVKNLELVDSRTVNVFCDEVLIDVDGLQFYISFKKDESKGRGEVYYKAEGEKTLRLTLYNFSNILNMGWYEPISVGHLNGRSLYMNMSLTTVDEPKNYRTMTYNLFLGEKINA
jgi:hypothetical protein